MTRDNFQKVCFQFPTSQLRAKKKKEERYTTEGDEVVQEHSSKTSIRSNCGSSLLYQQLPNDPGTATSYLTSLPKGNFSI